MSRNPPCPLAGPRRLILINSGKYDYAEIDLTKSFQLVGANGLGKTALIATLQYLYTDSQRDMRFGKHSPEESRKFYFRTDFSFILFECETSLGPMTLGVRSTGAAGNYEMQRFAWNGSYTREDFIDTNGRQKRWDEVRVPLGVKGLQLLPESADLRRLLGAIDEKTDSSWGLVPLGDARDYGRFRQTFQRLLHLHTIRQDDLKELLADCAKLTGPQRQIDLEKDSAKELAAIERDRAEIARLEAARPKVMKVRALFDDECMKRAVAHALGKELRARYRNYGRDHEHAKLTLYAVQEQCRVELGELAAKKNSLGRKRDTEVQKKALSQERLQTICDHREKFRDFVLEIEEYALEVINSEIARIQGKLSFSPAEPITVLEQDLRKKTEELVEQEKAAARIKSLFITWLKERLPAAEVSQLGALFNPRVLQSEIDEQVLITKETEFLQRIRAAIERCDARGYRGDLVEITFPQGAVSAVAQLGNVEAYKAKAAVLRREILHLEHAIDAKRNADAIHAALATKQQERRQVEKRLEEYKSFQEELSREATYKEAVAQAEAESATLETQINDIDTAITQKQATKAEATRRFDELNAEAREVDREALNMPVASGDDPGATSVGTEAVDRLPPALPGVFRQVRQKCREALSAAQFLNEAVALLDQDFLNASFPYDASAPIDERLQQLETQIAALEERNQTVQNSWAAVFSDARSGFKVILQSLASIKREIRKLNGELSSIEFSSLSNVRLDLVEDKAAVSEYERHAADIATPSVFDSVTDTDKSISQFHALIQKRPKLVLNDLFSLRCEVTRKDGVKNSYADFDAVESTGTTIVLKVTMNLLVLRDLLQVGKARIPYYLDEVHALDRQNFANIIQLSERLGFVGIFAAPTTAIGPRRFVHLVPDGKGRLVVTDAHRKEIVRDPSEAPATVDE